MFRHSYRRFVFVLGFLAVFLLTGAAFAPAARAQTHITGAEVRSVALPGRGNVRGVYLTVDGSKIWTFVRQGSLWPNQSDPRPLPPGYRIEVWAMDGRAPQLCRTARGREATRPGTFKGEPVCDHYFVCVFGTRDGRDFDLPVAGAPAIAPPQFQAAYCSMVFEGTNAGDSEPLWIRVHFTTNVEPLDHHSVNVGGDISGIGRW